ncbi:MAG: glycosyl hydrolase family 53, partial [Lachnospiraceae bacterium]|nr:glycosyl hydrolase family 53 [Lachnospiraceae bacterium]
MKRRYMKLLALCLSVSLSAAALAGCGADNADSTAPVTETEDAQEPQDAGETEEAQEPKEMAEIEVTSFPLPDGPEESEIYVEPISDISDDFIRGMDASSVLVEENSGVK